MPGILHGGHHVALLVGDDAPKHRPVVHHGGELRCAGIGQIPCVEGLIRARYTDHARNRTHSQRCITRDHLRRHVLLDEIGDRVGCVGPDVFCECQVADRLEPIRQRAVAFRDRCVGCRHEKHPLPGRRLFIEAFGQVRLPSFEDDLGRSDDP